MAGKSTVVVADRILCDDKDIGDYVKVSIPNISWKTSPVTGSGIGGDLDIPLVGLAEAMNMQIDQRALGKENAALLMTPGIHKIEIRFNRAVMDADGEVGRANTKIFINAMFTGVTPGGVQRGSSLDGNIALSVSRIRWVEEGKELFLFDQLNETYKVNGKDYSESYKL